MINIDVYFERRLAIIINKKLFDGMRAAQKIAIESVNESLNLLREGVSEIKFEKEVANIMKANGMDEPWYLTRIFFSNRTVIASKRFLSSNNKLKKGDIVSIKVHPSKSRFMGDYSITTIFGKNNQLQEFVDDAKEIELKTIKFVSGKVTGRAVFDFSLGLIREFGYMLLDLHGNVGHTVGRLPLDGLQFHKKFLEQKNNEKLQGFWTIEPFIGNGSYGAVFEDMVFIDKNEKKIIH